MTPEARLVQALLRHDLLLLGVEAVQIGRHRRQPKGARGIGCGCGRRRRIQGRGSLATR